MKKFILPILGMALISSCSSVKQTATVNNFDDAYFVPSDIDKSTVYGKVNPNMFQPRATAIVNNSRSTRSYSQSYNDRLRNFGGSTVAPSFRPALMVTPFGSSMGFTNGFNNPYMYGMNPYNPYGYDPYMMGYGYNPYYNPSWCYWNQYYSPYNYNYWGSGSAGGNAGSGSFWGGNKNASSGGFTGSGQRRKTYNSTIPSSSQGSRTGTTSSGTSWSGNTTSGSGDTYYRPSSSNNDPGTSSGSTYTRPSSSGPSQSTGGGQSGSSGRRR